MEQRWFVIAAEIHAARWSAASALHSLGRERFRSLVRADEDAPALLLSPHFDDAVLNCWSVLTAGRPLRIVNVFAGVPAPGFVTEWDRKCGARESAAFMRARSVEDERALGRLGHRPLDLTFIDSQYGARRPSSQEIDRAVAEVMPAASLAYAPAALGYAHPDHFVVRRYARALARQGLPVVLYADLPYAVRLGTWPAWVRGDDDGGGGLENAYWRSALRAIPEIADVDVVKLDRQAAAAKLDGMRSYRSQFSALDDGGRLSDPRTYSHEVFWRLGQRDLMRVPSRRRRIRRELGRALERPVKHEAS
jgi:LmbE family N-acetylglucosaminyl deacetylase